MKIGKQTGAMIAIGVLVVLLSSVLAYRLGMRHAAATRGVA